MEKIRKVSMLKAVRTNGVWFGYIAPSKVNHYHIIGGWGLGHRVNITLGRDGVYYVVSWYNNEFKELEGFLNAFEYYNCNSELGHSVRFWEEK